MSRRRKTFEEQLWSGIKMLVALAIIGTVAIILGFFALMIGLLQAAR